MQIEELALKLADVPEVRFALLFGSQAVGRPRPDSDVDVGVFLDPESTASERWRLRLRLIAELEGIARVDLVVLNDAPPLLAHRALMGRAIVMRNREAYVRFFVQTLALSEDERYFREMHRLARERRLQEGRFGRP